MPTTVPEQQLQSIADGLAFIRAKFEGDHSIEKQVALLLTEKTATADAVKGLRTELTDLKTNVDKNIATVEAFVAQRVKDGTRVPGTEDAAKWFSIGRYVHSRLQKDRSLAKREWDLIDAEAKAAQSIGDDKKGGNFIPEVVAAPINVATYAQSALIALNPADGQTNITVIDGVPGMAEISIPRFEGGVRAYWMGEGKPYQTTTADTGTQKISPKKLGVIVPFTEEMLRGDVWGLNKLIQAAVTSAFSEELDQTLLFSLGGEHQPKGIVGHITAAVDGVISGVKVYRAETGTVIDRTTAESGLTWAGKKASLDILEGMRLALSEDKIRENASFRWVTSPRAISYLKTLKAENYSAQTTGLPYLLGMPMTDAQLQSQIGNFSKTVNVPSLIKAGAIYGATAGSAKFSYIFGGNLDAFALARWSGLEVVTDGGQGPGFSNDMTQVKFRMWCGTTAMRPRELLFCPDVQVQD